TGASPPRAASQRNRERRESSRHTTATGVSMRDKRSYLDSVNAGRRRRAGASLEEIDMTLERLESQLGAGMFDEPDEDYRAGRGRYGAQARKSRGDDGEAARAFISGEMAALREELRSQMSSGLRREFAALKG